MSNTISGQFGKYLLSWRDSDKRTDTVNRGGEKMHNAQVLAESAAFVFDCIIHSKMRIKKNILQVV